MMVVLATSAFATAWVAGRKDTNFPPRPINLQLDLNLASETELSLVPGIGPITARRIVENRNRLGDFDSVGQVVRVHGIGPKTLDQVQNLCFVAEPSSQGRLAGRLGETETPRR